MNPAQLYALRRQLELGSIVAYQHVNYRHRLLNLIVANGRGMRDFQTRIESFGWKHKHVC